MKGDTIKSNTANSDLNEIKFSWFKLPFYSRVIFSAALYCISVAVQFLTKTIFVGLPFVIGAWVLLKQKTISNKPDDQGYEDWRAVEISTVDKILKSIQQIRKKGKKYSSNIGCAIVFIIVTILLSIFAIGDNNSQVGLAVINGLLFSIPALFAAYTKFFIPHELDKKFSTVVTLLNTKKPDGFVLTPYIRFDKDKQKNEIPEDIRFLLEKKHAPEDFIGVQFQVAINDGPNGEVPYLYAVALTKETGDTYNKLLSLFKRGNFIIEDKKEGGYGIIVIRQQTSGTGYHTTQADCERLWNFILNSLVSL